MALLIFIFDALSTKFMNQGPIISTDIKFTQQINVSIFKRLPNEILHVLNDLAAD
jgi:hypothetical protein